MLLLILLWALGVSALAISVMTARGLRRPGPPPVYPAELVAVILPCRDLDPHFRAMLNALARQDLPSYRLYFVVRDAAEPAVPLIHSFLAAHPGLGKLVIHAPSADYDGKIANMLGGVAAARTDRAGYYVFLDTDTVPGPTFISHLLGALAGKGVMLSTGARVLQPASRDMASWVGSLWLLGSLPGVVHPQGGSAWGGAMAIAARDAERLNLNRVWQGAFSDDHTLSQAVRAAGGRLAFAPDALVVNPTHYHWPDLLAFLVRQLLVIRVYDFRLWVAAWALAYPLAAAVAAAGWSTQGRWGMAWAALASLAPLIVSVYTIDSAVWRRLGQPAMRLAALSCWRQAAAVLLLAIIHPWVMLRSGLTQRFVWRQQSFRLVGRRLIAEAASPGGDS